MADLVEFISDLFNTKGYLLWLLVVSFLCFILERLVPWRKTQQWPRADLAQDIFYLIFNGQIVGLLIAWISVPFLRYVLGIFDITGLPRPNELNLLSGSPAIVQFGVYFVIKDLAEYIIHYQLHARSWLWTFHKLHHSLVTMDWIGNFRFHWMEIIVYRTLSWLPLVILGVGWDILLPIAVIVTLVGHLNHSNVRISWGPLRYVFNSARMHIWHHDYILHRPNGQNFAVVFSLWDWLFGTAYFPFEKEGPDRLGFPGMETFPRSLLARLLYPVTR